LVIGLAGAANAGTEALHDPTRPPAALAPAQNNSAQAPLQLEAIFHKGENCHAIIDGKLVRAGDRLGSALIEEINADSVRYSRNGRSQIVQLKSLKIQVRRDPAADKDPT
jgi:hypothetical protein